MDPEQLAAGVRAGDPTLLPLAITMVESQLEEHQVAAQELLRAVLPAAGGAHRIGVSGVPGVGKSTFLESFGTMLADRGHRVAVLAVDPSSRVSGGSILGDKARMTRLAQHPRAFIRPSPSGATLGGVARRTRESMLLCEAAGYDVVLVETVGVGQSETEVAGMVDSFLLLLLPGAGDELQGIKKGILELADVVAVNKADGDHLPRARRAVGDYGAALRYLRPRAECWNPQVVAVSAREGEGLEELWKLLQEHREALVAAGEFDRRRRQQRAEWLWHEVDALLLSAFRADPAVQQALLRSEAEVLAGRLPATQAAHALLAEFMQRNQAPGSSPAPPSP